MGLEVEVEGGRVVGEEVGGFVGVVEDEEKVFPVSITSVENEAKIFVAVMVFPEDEVTRTESGKFNRAPS